MINELPCLFFNPYTFWHSKDQKSISFPTNIFRSQSSINPSLPMSTSLAGFFLFIFEPKSKYRNYRNNFFHECPKIPHMAASSTQKNRNNRLNTKISAIGEILQQISGPNTQSAGYTSRYCVNWPARKLLTGKIAPYTKDAAFDFLIIEIVIPKARNLFDARRNGRTNNVQ